MDHFDPGDPFHQDLFCLLEAMVEQDLVRPPLERWELEQLTEVLLIAKAHSLRARTHWLLANRPSA